VRKLASIHVLCDAAAAVLLEDEHSIQNLAMWLAAAAILNKIYSLSLLLLRFCINF